MPVPCIFGCKKILQSVCFPDRLPTTVLLLRNFIFCCSTATNSNFPPFSLPAGPAKMDVATRTPTQPPMLTHNSFFLPSLLPLAPNPDFYLFLRRACCYTAQHHCGWLQIRISTCFYYMLALVVAQHHPLPLLWLANCFSLANSCPQIRISTHFYYALANQIPSTLSHAKNKSLCDHGETHRLG